MAFCENCGASLSQSTGFCGVCGKQIAASAPDAAPVAPEPPANAPASGWTPIAPQPVVAAPSTSWTPAPNQPSPNPDRASDQGWTPIAAEPSASSSPPVQNWNTQAVSSATSNWNSGSTPPGAAVAPAMAAAGTGLTPNLAGALAYSLGVITGVLFLALEPYSRNRFVRFHAMQSILYFVAAVAFRILWSIVVGILLHISGWVAFVAFPMRMLISLGLFGLWLYLMYQAYSQREFRLPIIGEIASKYAG